MPDLNLIDDEGMSDDIPDGAEEVVETGGGGGGAGKVIIILLILLIVLLGGVYVLNTMGIISLWGTKQTQVMTVEEQYPEEFYDDAAFAEQPVDTSWMMEQPADDVALLETTPLEEPADDMAAEMAVSPVDEAPVGAPAGSTLGDMKGDFTIQVVAYREKEKADRILSNLEFTGYPAFIEKVPMKGGDWYTVRIGKYPTRTAAREAVATFAEQIRSNYFIDKVRSR